MTSNSSLLTIIVCTNEKITKIITSFIILFLSVSELQYEVMRKNKVLWSNCLILSTLINFKRIRTRIRENIIRKLHRSLTTHFAGLFGRINEAFWKIDENTAATEKYMKDDDNECSSTKWKLNTINCSKKIITYFWDSVTCQNYNLFFRISHHVSLITKKSSRNCQAKH